MQDGNGVDEGPDSKGWISAGPTHVPSPEIGLGASLASLAPWRFTYVKPSALCFSAIVSASRAIAW